MGAAVDKRFCKRGLFGSCSKGVGSYGVDLVLILGLSVSSDPITRDSGVLPWLCWYEGYSFCSKDNRFILWTFRSEDFDRGTFCSKGILVLVPSCFRL